MHEISLFEVLPIQCFDEEEILLLLVLALAHHCYSLQLLVGLVVHHEVGLVVADLRRQLHVLELFVACLAPVLLFVACLAPILAPVPVLFLFLGLLVALSVYYFPCFADRISLYLVNQTCC